MQKTVVSLCLAPLLFFKPQLWSQHLPESPSLVLGALTRGTIVVSHVIPDHYLLPSLTRHQTVGPPKRKRPPKLHLDLKRHHNSRAKHPRRPLAPTGPPLVLPGSAKVATRTRLHTRQTSDIRHHTSCPCRAANPRPQPLFQTRQCSWGKPWRQAFSEKGSRNTMCSFDLQLWGFSSFSGQ